MVEKRDRERNRVSATETDSLPQDEAGMHQSKVNEIKEESKREENNLPTEEQAKPEYGNKEINELLEIIKKACLNNGLIYS